MVVLYLVSPCAFEMRKVHYVPKIVVVGGFEPPEAGHTEKIMYVIFTIYLLGSLRVPGTITWYSASPLLIGKQGLLKNSQV